MTIRVTTTAMELSSYLSMQHLFLLLTFLQILVPVYPIGVNYGTKGDNLPLPSEVAQFLKESTIIDRIKIFDMDTEIIKAFADTGIYVTVTVPNGDIPSLGDADKADKWVKDNIKPYYPDTKIHYIAVGNEILHWGTKEQIDGLVPAMKKLHQALVKAEMPDIKVTTPHSLGIMLSSDPPSSGAFRPGWDVGIIKPMLQFLNETKSGFMVNPYPYFGYSPGNDSFALFKENPGFKDPETGKEYDNMFDSLMDAIHIAMKKLGYGDVPIVIGETGWPSLGEPWLTWVNVDNAKSYNEGMIKKSNSSVGTPLMPNKNFEIYIFALFNENQKDGSLAERNFGLFKPDFTEVYDIGVMNGTAPKPKSHGPAASPSSTSPGSDSGSGDTQAKSGDKTPSGHSDAAYGSQTTAGTAILLVLAAFFWS
ncbi:glycoside hydrolase family 17 [Artemisia annua]|uniref:glucan endo-1,3-beta-D-glucosidase n=1 Tax=Artemisia annua TaxID=35608 RepID=A0A2U1KGL0_ARTAN|nr:glycoside hydrolase family 17 [Artemisia annua]